VPGLLYQGAGWGAFTLTLTAFIGGAIVLTRGLRFGPADKM